MRLDEETGQGGQKPENAFGVHDDPRSLLYDGAARNASDCYQYADDKKHGGKIYFAEKRQYEIQYDDEADAAP